MGKATFYRKQKLGCVNYLVVFLPLIGGTTFLVGSLFFWPGFGIYQHELRHLGPDGRPILAEHAEDMGNSTTTHRLCLFYSRYFDENHTFRLEHDQCAELMGWSDASLPARLGVLLPCAADRLDQAQDARVEPQTRR